MSISTHVLDAALGRPAAGMPVALHRRAHGADWVLVAEATTDADGRVPGFTGVSATGVHRLSFAVASYAPGGFFPEISIVFCVDDPDAHLHVPLLLSPFAYSTYRGS